VSQFKNISLQREEITKLEILMKRYDANNPSRNRQ